MIQYYQSVYVIAFLDPCKSHLTRSVIDLAFKYVHVGFLPMSYNLLVMCRLCIARLYGDVIIVTPSIGARTRIQEKEVKARGPGLHLPLRRILGRVPIRRGRRSGRALLLPSKLDQISYKICRRRSGKPVLLLVAFRRSPYIHPLQLRCVAFSSTNLDVKLPQFPHIWR